MAAKKSAAKGSAKASGAKKAAAKKAPSRASSNRVAVSASKAQITVNAADAEKCLRETGKITLGLREVGVTRLRDLVDNEVIVN